MIDYVLHVLPREIFSTVHLEIIDWLKTCADQERRPDKINAASELSDAASAELSRILMNSSDTLEKKDFNAFDDSMRILRQAVLHKKHCELLAQAEKYSSNKDAAYIETIQESLKIKTEIDNMESNE